MEKCNSYYRVRINNSEIGYATVIYHYYTLENIVSSEIIPYPALKAIPNIQIANSWGTYAEEAVNAKDQSQEKHLIEATIKNIVTNLSQFRVDLELLRESFRLTVSGFQCYLVHELDQRLFDPGPYKQVQVLSDNRMFRFDSNKSVQTVAKELEKLL